MTFIAPRRAFLTLWLELSIAALIVPTLALTHGLGLLAMSRMFNLTDDALLHRRLSPRSILLVAFMAILLFTLHSIEIGAVGLLFLFGGACRTLTQALVLSASYYTTTGAGPETLPAGWRIIGHAESLLGLLLIGWSTAFLVRKIDRLQEREHDRQEEMRRRRLRQGSGYGGHEEEAAE